MRVLRNNAKSLTFQVPLILYKAVKRLILFEFGDNRNSFHGSRIRNDVDEFSFAIVAYLGKDSSG